eukprot:365788-Chlamydomonas_euryale.AAC.8
MERLHLLTWLAMHYTYLAQVYGAHLFLPTWIRSFHVVSMCLVGSGYVTAQPSGGPTYRTSIATGHLHAVAMKIFELLANCKTICKPKRLTALCAPIVPTLGTLSFHKVQPKRSEFAHGNPLHLADMVEVANRGCKAKIRRAMHLSVITRLQHVPHLDYHANWVSCVQRRHAHSPMRSRKSSFSFATEACSPDYSVLCMAMQVDTRSTSTAP